MWLTAKKRIFSILTISSWLLLSAAGVVSAQSWYSSANDVFTTAQTDGDDSLVTVCDGTTKVAHEIDVYIRAQSAFLATVGISWLATTTTGPVGGIQRQMTCWLEPVGGIVKLCGLNIIHAGANTQIGGHGNANTDFDGRSMT